MKKLLVAAPLAALLLAACQEYGPSPERVRPAPQPVRFTGRILDRNGPCATIRSFRTGRLYSVRPAGLGNIPPGTVVRVNGIYAGRRACPHPIIRLRRVRPI